MPDRKVEVKIVGDSRSLEHAFGRAQASGSKLEHGLRGIGKASAIAIGTGIGVGLVGLGLAAHTAYGELAQATKVGAQTNAVIKSTGGIANVSAKHVDTLANSLLQKSGVDDEVTKSGENMLLTFKNVRNEVGKGNDIFDQATKLTLDMDVAMSHGNVTMESLSKRAILVGKALNDPVKGMTALRRVGVTFSEDQVKLIGHLEATGHHLAAQKIIVGELRSEFGGSAAAIGRTWPGMLNTIRENLRNFAADALRHAIPTLQTIIGLGKDATDFIGRVVGAPSLSVGIDVAVGGVKDVGLRIKNSVQTAIGSVDWKPIGQQLATTIGSGLVFTSDQLNRLAGSVFGWVEQHATQIADIGAELAVRMALALTDPAFWAHHMDLLLGVVIVAFGRGMPRLAARLGRSLAEFLGPSFERAAGEVAFRFMSGLARLPGLVGNTFAALTTITFKALRVMFRLIEEAPTIISRALRLDVAITVWRVGISALRSAWTTFSNWIHEKSLGVVGSIAEPFSHLPGRLGGWARDLKNDVNRQLDQIHSVKTVSLKVKGGQFTETITDHANNKTTISGTLYAGPHAMGGRIRMGSGRADDVHALLAKDEFVVTPGGERMLESMTFPGVLNYLEGRQPPAFAGGGRVFDSIAGSIGAAGSSMLNKDLRSGQFLKSQGLLDPIFNAASAMFGGSGAHGLVPQVLRALSFARGHGWRGSVISGFRTYAEQAALYARYLAGGPLAAKPGTSSHERGQAVDVSDWGTFGRTMAGAPAGSRLFNFLGAADPPHWSVSGYRRGGRAGHHAPHLPASIREAEARAAGTAGLGDDIAASGRELAWVNKELGRKDLTSSERSSLRTRRIRVQNRLKSLRSRRARQRRRSSTDITIPTRIRLAEANARLTGPGTAAGGPSGLDDDIRAKQAEVAWLASELRKHPGPERRIALENMYADATDELQQLAADQREFGGGGADAGGDLQAQLDQANAKLATAQEAERLQAAFIATGVFAGSGAGGGGPAGPLGGGGGHTFVFQSLFPYTEDQARQAAAASAQGASRQPYRTTSVVPSAY